MSSILKSFTVHVEPLAAIVCRPVEEEAVASTPAHASAPQEEVARPPDPEEIAREAAARGYAEGLRQGWAEGFSQGQREVEGVLATARSILAEVAEWQQVQLGQELPNLVALAIAIAERIVRRAVQVDGEVVVRTLAEAVRQREARDLVRIALHPDDAEAVRAYWERAHPTRGDVEISADPGIERGGCLLFTQSSLIDALLQTQLDVIARDLQGGRV